LKFISFFLLLPFFALQGQTVHRPMKTQVMTLGVFHFAYHNLDVVKTRAEDQISVLDSAYQDEIRRIARAVAQFKPTIIAVEKDPGRQPEIDSLYAVYGTDRWEARRSEVYQLGFRLAQMLELDGVHCVNDWGMHYPHIQTWFKDSTRMARFDHYFNHSPDSIYATPRRAQRIHSVISELKALNDPAEVQENLGSYLTKPFKYEETPGDFTGVDFETGRWFSRNLRIFRNVQRLAQRPGERILVIIGAGHLTLLNPFFESCREFELISPVPCLEAAEKAAGGA